MNDHDTGVAELLRNATEDLDPPSADIVARSLARGRVSRRRHLTGTTVATAVVIGVIGVGVTVVPDLLGDDGPRGSSVELLPADDGVPRELPKDEPIGEDVGEDVGEATVHDRPRAGARDLAVAALEIPAAVQAVLGGDHAGDVLTRPPYPVVDEPYQRIAHFLWDGMLTSVIIEPVGIADEDDCRNVRAPGAECLRPIRGKLVTSWGDETADQVTARGIVAWSGDGWRVSLVSYNAPEGKDVPPLAPQPPLTQDQLLQVATSEIWYR